MKRELIKELTQDFESAARLAEDVEFWHPRDLQGLLGYTKWDNFHLVIEMAKMACRNAGQEVSDHFVDVTKMIDLGKGAQREIDDTIVIPRLQLFGKCPTLDSHGFN